MQRLERFSRLCSTWYTRRRTGDAAGRETATAYQRTAEASTIAVAPIDGMELCQRVSAGFLPGRLIAGSECLLDDGSVKADHGALQWCLVGTHLLDADHLLTHYAASGDGINRPTTSASVTTLRNALSDTCV